MKTAGDRAFALGVGERLGPRSGARRVLAHELVTDRLGEQQVVRFAELDGAKRDAVGIAEQPEMMTRAGGKREHLGQRRGVDGRRWDLWAWGDGVDGGVFTSLGQPSG